jgi:hypothetical protein
MPKTYQLYLATEITSPTSNNVVPINITNKGNATWQVDFKSLFGDDINKFKRCTLRAHFLSQVFNTSDTAYDAYSGYLTINLPTVQSASTSKGTPLMLLSPSLAPYSTTSKISYDCSSLGNVQGVDIPMPNANQLFNVQLINSDSFNTISSVPDYQLILQFELLDEIV